MPRERQKPSDEQIERIARNSPHILNVLVAYFVFEWQSINPRSVTDEVQVGMDQVGKVRLVPDYVGRYGADACVLLLKDAPKSRSGEGPGALTYWWRRNA